MPASAPVADRGTAALTPDAAWQMLVEGNGRFVAGRLSRPNQTVERRTSLATTQQPFATILGCSDSRVSPELLFDQGMGDLFVVRVAGNVADDAAKGSIEYAVEHLGSSLVVVLGHERCGAVSAAVDTAATGAVPHGHVAALVQAIRPAVEQVKGMAGDTVDNAVKANVTLVVSQLRATPVLAHLLGEGKVKIIGARYDLDTGRAELLG